MLLAIDIGNTNTEFGVFSGENLIANFRLVSNHNVTSDELGIMMSHFFSIHNIAKSDITDVLIASVVPQIMHSVTNAMRKYLDKIPLIVGEDVIVPIVNKYANPTEVGADRLVNAYIALEKYSGPLVIVDFGTATTFDVINKAGEYLGGVIYPGIKISMDALFQNAAKLPKVELLPPKNAIGKNTINSMQSGAIHGYTGAVLNIINEVKLELNLTEIKTVATGGLATFIDRDNKIFDITNKVLTLQGLQRLYEKRGISK